ncbi:glycosyltransferase family 2 protein [uncultured Desulfovibrio sp.]|uniref:glycosyltransferase family 2 protein n=1 Tax=uncultured Desulfovibrio sp. TaxID=167968 RepID=UPI0003A843A3|nr:glycosyltransferase family 2 protein [uncultured Desulfovibrio sp.]
MKLSIVTTLYYSAPYVEEFHRRASAAARQLAGEDYEIVMVNDGSPDNAVDLAIALTNSDPHMVVVDLSRNFGHHKAIMAGIGQTSGEKVFVIDVDLEEEPELLHAFWHTMENQGVDLVYGVQKSRKGGWFERWSGGLFYGMFNALSPITIPKNTIIAKLMTRRFADALLEHRERTIFLGGLIALTGFSQASLLCVKKSKPNTTYTFRRKLAQCVDSITSFSARPLYFFFWFGGATMIISFFALTFLMARRILMGTTVEGWTSLFVITCLFFGLTMMALGTTGIYLSKIFEEVKGRPYVVIRQILRYPSCDGKS